jgi:hypothetical protein
MPPPACRLPVCPSPGVCVPLRLRAAMRGRGGTVHHAHTQYRSRTLVPDVSRSSVRRRAPPVRRSIPVPAPALPAGRLIDPYSAPHVGCCSRSPSCLPCISFRSTNPDKLVHGVLLGARASALGFPCSWPATACLAYTLVSGRPGGGLEFPWLAPRGRRVKTGELVGGWEGIGSLDPAGPHGGGTSTTRD